MGTVELQKIIKIELNRLGWSIRRFADELYIETYPVDNEDEMNAHFEKIKKHLTRTNYKNTDKLKSYVNFIVRTEEYDKNRIMPHYESLGILSEELKHDMAIVSKELDKYLSK